MKILIPLMILLVICRPTSAAIRPSFLPEQCSWKATDIVVVSEDSEMNAKFTVLETLKGELKSGDTVSIPEMSEFKTKENRLVNNGWFNREKDVNQKFVSGDRMILFLRDVNKKPFEPDEDEDKNVKANASDSNWRSANPMGSEVKYSTVWIEGGQVYGFVQEMNPGPSLLSDLGMTESKLRDQVSEVLNTQKALDDALTENSLTVRAERLDPFVHNSLYFVRQAAFKSLIACGRTALPVLSRMLDDESLGESRDTAIDAFASAGGKTVGPELTQWVAKEMAFWKKTGPTLHKGWISGEGLGLSQMDGIEAAKPLAQRWSALNAAVNALGTIRYKEAENTLIELSDFWRTMPQLSGDDVGSTCDEVLRKFGATKNPRWQRPLPRYELSFSGNKAFTSEQLTAKVGEYAASFDHLGADYADDTGRGGVEFALDKLMDFISSRGFLKVGFQTAVYSGENGPLYRVKVIEGNRYRVGKIRIDGNKLFSSESIRARLQLIEGDIANGEKIRKWEEDLEKAYHDRGYLDCYVSRDIEEVPNSTRKGIVVADLKFTIDERMQFKVGSIKFEGKTNIPGGQLLGMLALHEGDVFTKARLDESIEQLNNLGLGLEKDTDIDTSVDSNAGLVNVVIFVDKDRPRPNSYNRRFMN